MERLVEVSDHEIRIEFAPNCKCRANITLRSLKATTPVAFKVQTSSPHKFLVNSPSGLIPPLSSTTIQVILKPQTHLPSTFPRSHSDRFLIKTAIASELALNSTESAHTELINSWFNSVPRRPTYDVKLNVAFVGAFLLSHAVGVGDCESIRKLIKRQRSVVAELSTREAESLFGLATQLENSDEIVNLLLEAGLKVDAHGDVDDVRWASKGWSELHVAVALDRTAEVERLVKQGEWGSLDCRDKEGRTPLHLAARKGYLGCAKVLVSAGADVDARSKDGRTALYRAAANGDRQMVKLLLDNGSDPSITGLDVGRSAVDVARDKGHKEVIKILERGEEVIDAARRGNLVVLERLLEKGANMNFSDQYGFTPLHIAAIKGHKDVIMLLAEFGAKLDCPDLEDMDHDLGRQLVMQQARRAGKGGASSSQIPKVEEPKEEPLLDEAPQAQASLRVCKKSKRPRQRRADRDGLDEVGELPSQFSGPTEMDVSDNSDRFYPAWSVRTSDSISNATVATEMLSKLNLERDWASVQDCFPENVVCRLYSDLAQAIICTNKVL